MHSSWFKYLISLFSKLMKSFENFIVTIILKVPFFRRWTERKLEIMDNTNPDAIKVSDIAQFYCISMRKATFLCEMACKYRLYSKNEDGTYKLIEKE